MTTNYGRFAGVRVLIFDLDGTLIDSKLDLAHAVNAMLEHMGREEHVHETIFSFIGDGAAMLVRRALGEGVTEAEVGEGLDYFLKYYRAHMLDNTVAYPGVREALAELAGDSAGRGACGAGDGRAYEQAGGFQPRDSGGAGVVAVFSICVWRE